MKKTQWPMFETSARCEVCRPLLHPTLFSAADVMDICDGLTELASTSTTGSLHVKEVGAMAAAVREELVLCTLITTTKQVWSEESFVRRATQLFANYGITLKSLETLLTILSHFRQFACSEESR